MCDELTQKDADDFLGRSAVTRRQFGKLSAAAGLSMLLPPGRERPGYVRDRCGRCNSGWCR